MSPRAQRLRAAAPWAACALIALVYWPILRGGFVWDDKIAFVDAAWLRQGDAWLHYAWVGISGSVNYFRPLVVALYTAEVRAFDLAPWPMHLVSLLLHLLNTLLVGGLARRVLRAPQPTFWPALAMLLYGLHPVLVEPVAWISCQYDMVATLFVLAALYANLALEGTVRRAFAVGAAFLLAAAAKESAACLPPLLLLFDLEREGRDGRPWRDALAALWRRQRAVYLAVLVAAALYLIARRAALGHLVAPIGNVTPLSFAHLQKMCATYLAYWRLALWPMAGLGPLHVVDEGVFARVDSVRLAVDVGALSIAALGVVAFLRRNAVGALILCFSAALLPVLNLVPTLFVESLYHERYAMIALGMACVWFPLLLGRGFAHHSGARRLRPVAFALGAFWLAGCALNIRVTLPLWSDELRLWQWALRLDPASIVAKDHLLAEYMGQDDRAQVDAIVRDVLDHDLPCPNCLLNAAFATITEGDAARAQLALDRLGARPEAVTNARILHGYILAQGELAELRGQFADAEEAYRAAQQTDPLDPVPPLRLALLFARQDRATEARSIGDTALALFAPGERPSRREQIEAAIRAGAAAPAPPSAPTPTPPG